MPDCRLRIGMRFIKQGREFVIEQRLSDGQLRIRDIASDTCSAEAPEALIEDLFAGRLELIGEENYRADLKQKITKSRVSDLSQLSDDDPLKIEIHRRLKYVNALLKAQPCARTKDTLLPLIAEIGQRISDPKPPSWVTVNRWFRRYMAAGQDIRALTPAFKARGNKRRKISGQLISKYTEEDDERARVVLNIMERVINTKYLSKERPSVQSVHDTLAARIIEENRHRDADDQLPIPHITTLHKIIKTLDPYDVDSARYGKKYADEKHRAYGQGPRPSRPLERVECDHTRIDLMVVDDETRLPLGRPWLTLLIDVFTKMILGFYLAFHKPGALSVMQGLLHAIRPKNYLRAEYPQIEHDWPTFGIPEWVDVDNAPEFWGDDLDDACLQLGMDVEYSPVRRAWFRPSVERWFRTYAKSLHEIPGTTFSDIFDKKGYDPGKHALISFRAALEILHIWIVDIYNQRVHRGIKDIPYRRWVEGVKDWPPNLPPNSIELDVLIGFVEYRTVSKSGIELFTLLYNNAALSLIRRALKPGERVKVKYDPNDISVIYVWDKTNIRFIPVPALDQDYTRRLTLWQHNVIKKYAQRFVRGQLDMDALYRAKEQIQLIIARERQLKRRISRSEKLARYLNIAQPIFGKEDGDAHDSFMRASEYASLADDSQPQLIGEHLLTSTDFTAESSNNGNSRTDSAKNAKAACHADSVADEAVDNDQIQPDGGWNASYKLPPGREYENEQA